MIYLFTISGSNQKMNHFSKTFTSSALTPPSSTLQTFQFMFNKEEPLRHHFPFSEWSETWVELFLSWNGTTLESGSENYKQHSLWRPT